MIIFKTLKIKDFKSIASAELNYEAGVWEIKGVNNDAAFASNGSGKTSCVEAIQQCLYNKTVSSPPIEDISRKTLGAKFHKRQGYRLELTFEKDGIEYLIINDRGAMRIQVFEDGMDLMIKSIPAALKYIVSIIGMDFNTFVTLTFINHDTIVDLLDNFSSSSLMKVVLNFSQISSFEKAAKVEQRALNSEITSLNSELQTVKTSLEVLGQYREIDLTPLYLKKVQLEKSKKDLEEDVLIYVLEDEKKYREEDEKLNEIQTLLDNNNKKYLSSVCECCGQLLNLSEKDREDLKVNITLLEDELADKQKMVDVLEKSAIASRARYEDTLKEVTDEEVEIDRSLLEAKTKNQLYESSVTHANDLREKEASITRDIEYKEFRLTVLQTSLLVLKSGDIQKELLDTFVTILNMHLAKFIEFVSLDYVTITAEASKANVSFKLFDSRFNHSISIHTLSGGEKTRLRLVVLLSMLQTIRDLTQTATNIVVFDESLDTLDATAAGDLASLFDYLINRDNKFIALVSHGDQLKDIQFSGTIYAEKTDGVTNIRIEHV